MHEVSLVAQLVAHCEERAAGAPVSLVRVRHASSIPATAIEYAFAMLAPADLAAATLELEPFDVTIECSCGFAGALAHDDVIDSTTACCPNCGDLCAHERTADLELVEVRTNFPMTT